MGIGRLRFASRAPPAVIPCPNRSKATPEVHGPFEFDGSHVATGSHSGEANFQVHVYPAEGSFGELVFNEVGQYDGETTFRHSGVGWVAVQAGGDWSLELE